MKKREFKSAKELLIALSYSDDMPSCEYIFRGHSSSEYKLIPSSLRSNGDFWNQHDGLSDFDKKLWANKEEKIKQEKYQMEAEFRILREFYKLCDRNGLYIPNIHTLREKILDTYHFLMEAERNIFKEWLPVDLYEIAALAQHYGLSTRLLDWTTDPMVAAFFAFSNMMDEDGDVCIYALNTSVIIRNKQVCDKLKIIVPPYHLNPNLCAQKGVLSHWVIKFNELTEENPKSKSGTRMADFLPIDKKVDRRPLDELVQSSCTSEVFTKYILPKKEAKKGLSLLNNLGYNAARLFPGYTGVVKQIKDGIVVL